MCRAVVEGPGDGSLIADDDKYLEARARMVNIFST